MEKKKRTIFWIIPIAILGAFVYFFGPKDTITDNEYITYLKAAPLTSDNLLTTEVALSNVCENGGWEYFETKMFERVVEYKGECQVDGKLEPINLQFIVEKDKSSHIIGAMLVNSSQQTDEQRDEFIQALNK
ncbi:glucosamine 6-phosphate synthetase [Solibacillus sp. FSL K6-1523]|uniref:glucosamine 6-phosphate synthetase n=1 Tax=Solibacillus sp. FSL K6-1523 TaxID=2921471 RepID=UPI0030F897BB